MRASDVTPQAEPTRRARTPLDAPKAAPSACARLAPSLSCKLMPPGMPLLHPAGAHAALTTRKHAFNPQKRGSRARGVAAAMAAAAQTFAATWATKAARWASSQLAPGFTNAPAITLRPKSPSLRRSERAREERGGVFSFSTVVKNSLGRPKAWVLGMDSCRRPASSKHVLALPDEAWIREIVRSIKEENPSYGVKRVWMAIRVHGWGVSQQVTDAASPRRGSSLFAFHHDRACVRG